MSDARVPRVSMKPASFAMRMSSTQELTFMRWKPVPVYQPSSFMYRRTFEQLSGSFPPAARSASSASLASAVAMRRMPGLSVPSRLASVRVVATARRSDFVAAASETPLFCGLAAAATAPVAAAPASSSAAGVAAPRLLARVALPLAFGSSVFSIENNQQQKIIIYRTLLRYALMPIRLAQLVALRQRARRL
jgi:hypothetical protein